MGKQNNRRKTISKKKKIHRYYILLSIITILLIIILIFYQDFFNPNAESIPTETEPDEYLDLTDSIEDPQELPLPETIKTDEQDKTKVSRGILCFVIDDVGNNIDNILPFLKFKGPLTFAVMPQRIYTSKAAEMIRSAGKEVIMHLPMEPEGSSNPGEGAIYNYMDKNSIEEVMRRNLEDLSFIKGINNHMGSSATGNSEIMEILMDFLKKKNLFFLDSMTTLKTKGKIIAEKINLPYLQRNSMFLDNEKDKDLIMEAINKGLSIAEKQGHAIMIGHIVTNELAELLIEIYPDLIEEGYTLKELSEFLLEKEL